MRVKEDGTEVAEFSDANGYVYRTLLQRISDGTLKPGLKLGEGAIADELGTSRTPVREALRTLAAEGLVEIIHNRGARVRAWTEEQILETYGLRALLESYGVRRACEFADRDDIAQLNEVQSKMDALISQRERDVGYLDELARLNSEFHSAIVRMAHSTLLEGMINALSSVAMIGRTFRGFQPDDIERSRIHHHDIIHGIAARDPEYASAVMSAHILAARPAALAMLREAEMEQASKLSAAK